MGWSPGTLAWKLLGWEAELRPGGRMAVPPRRRGAPSPLVLPPLLLLLHAGPVWLSNWLVVVVVGWLVAVWSNSSSNLGVQSSRPSLGAKLVE